MKKLLAFAMVLCVGVCVAVGCAKEDKKVEKKKDQTTTTTTTEKSKTDTPPAVPSKTDPAK